MAKLDFNLHTYAFERGMTALLESYREAEEAVARYADNARWVMTDYERRVTAGESREYEYDDDGTTLYEYGQLYELNLEDAESAVAELRNSFVVAFYHQWERGAQRWGTFNPAAQPRHDALIRATEKLEVEIPDRMTAVHHLVNLLKHGGDRWADKLKVSWPDIVMSRSVLWPDRRREVMLDPKHVVEVHATLMSAAPPALRV